MTTQQLATQKEKADGHLALNLRLGAERRRGVGSSRVGGG